MNRKYSTEADIDLCDVSAANICNSVQNNVFIRAKLLEKADWYYDKGMFYDSVAHQVEALCIGFRSKYRFSNESSTDIIDLMLEDLKKMGPRESKHLTGDECPFDFSSLDDMMSELQSSKAQNKSRSKPPPPPPTLDANCSTLPRCSELPSEWTVLQITKQFDPKSSVKSASEILETDSPIYYTLLAYPHMHLNSNQPLTIRLENKAGFDKSDNMFEKNAKICQMIKAAMKLKDIPLYTKSLAEVDKTITEVLDQMLLHLGPYLVLFLGEFKEPEAKRQELETLNKVKQFFAEENLTSTRDLSMTFLIARGIDLLNYEDLDTYAIQFSTDSHLSKRMNDFLYDLKGSSPLSYKSPCYPTILIVDELLDGFYWEMLVPDKELCRCSTLHILLEISKRYKSRIKDGYLQLNIHRGTALINLGDDLPVMQKRISAFYDYWKPSWKQYVKVTPSAEEIKEVLKESDVIVYSGHGSGQQFVNPETIQELDANSVVFLFGCESVKLVSYGQRSERLGIHLFYHYILCPLVVGALTVVTDTPTDQICVTALSTWLRSDVQRSKHLQYIDRKKFKEGKLEFTTSKIFKELTEEHDPNLLSIFAKVRQIAVLPVWMRAAFVLRGIPVWNADQGI